MASTFVSPLAFAFGGPADWLILFIVALIVFGPKKLPEVGQQLGKALREFRKVADEVTGATRSIHDEITAAAGQIRADVEPRLQMTTTAPRPIEQPIRELADPMAPAPQVGGEAPKAAGLRLSTDPESGPNAERKE